MSHTPQELLEDIIEGMAFSQIMPDMAYKSMWYKPVTALPAASAKTRGKTMLLETAGADDALYLCIRLAAGGYAWKKVV